jgi:tRNA (guanine37-N1)-methyltransferase
MRVDILTIFPAMFGGVFDWGIVRRAREGGLIALAVHDLRDWSTDRHRTTDDAPYGGGPGMVMRVEPLVAAVEALGRAAPGRRGLVLLSPRGAALSQGRLQAWANLEQLILVAGRYEGVDERFIEITEAEEISIGDYVLSGGEIPAMVVVDGLVRVLPGATSDPASIQQDSFQRGLLDYPHYTRPAEFRGRAVPRVLLSGDHQAIRRWRKAEAVRATLDRRPELLLNAVMDDEERAVYEALRVTGLAAAAP